MYPRWEQAHVYFFLDSDRLPQFVMQIEALRAVGVDEVVLAINYQPEVFHNVHFQMIIEFLHTNEKSEKSSIHWRNPSFIKI